MPCDLIFKLCFLEFCVEIILLDLDIKPKVLVRSCIGNAAGLRHSSATETFSNHLRCCAVQAALEEEAGAALGADKSATAAAGFRRGWQVSAERWWLPPNFLTSPDSYGLLFCDWLFRELAHSVLSEQD